MHVKHVAELIYKDYKVHVAKSLLLRSGYLLVGVCDSEQHVYSTAELSTTSDPHRPDSVAEHTDGVITLACAVSMWMPELIPPHKLGRIVRLFLYHDAAETVSGDIPDDGNRDDAQKDREECQTLIAQTAHWLPRYQNELIGDFVRFQHHEGVELQVAYCIDKIEAVLRLLEYERAGLVGSLANKPKMSDQDRRFSEEIGTYIAADGWARHAIQRIEGCTGHDLAYHTMATAFAEVRGSVPAWMHKFAP